MEEKIKAAIIAGARVALKPDDYLPFVDHGNLKTLIVDAVAKVVGDEAKAYFIEVDQGGVATVSRGDYVAQGV